MSKATQLEVLDRDITIPGCVLTRTGLKLDTIDEATLLHVGAFLDQVDASRAWWHGDYLLAFCEFRLAAESKNVRDEAKADPKMRQRLFRRYTAERIDIAKVELDTLHEWRDVAGFYSLLRRRSNLSNNHHLEAMVASGGDAAVADEWLDKAEENKWTVPQLRAAIRQAKRAQQEPDEPMPEVTQQELFACQRWARTVVKRVDDMPRGEAEQLLRELQPILALATALAARVASPSKESIGRTAA
ncbi:MAG: hypothetical protein RJA36_3828 [Pseudomonadota bacterium]|jgi:hypothetical protein